MRWEDNRESDNVEDRRDDSGGGGMGFGGIHLGLGGIILVLLGSWLFGVNPMAVLGLLSGGGNATAPAPSQPARQPPANDQLARIRVDNTRQHRRRMGRDLRAVRPHL